MDDGGEDGSNRAEHVIRCRFQVTYCQLPAPIGGHLNVPQSAKSTSQGQSKFSDGFGPLFNIYVW